MAAQFWLVKQEPSAYSWDDFVKEKSTTWSGIRNYQARNNLRDMKKGDWVLFYHSVSEKRIVGLAQVAKEHYPDPAAKEGDWSAVTLQAVKPLEIPVTLDQMKADAKLANLPLIKHTRLSVMPVGKPEFNRILQVAKTKLP